MKRLVKNRFSGRVRVRACGVLIKGQKILMIKHRGLGSEGYLWIPPGGGVEAGHSIEDTVKREFIEETGLTVECGAFLFLNEFIGHDLHAVEIFLDVRQKAGKLRVGRDPEMDGDQQIIEEVKFLSLDELRREGRSKVHSRFCDFTSFDELYRAKGFFNFKNIYLK